MAALFCFAFLVYIPTDNRVIETLRKIGKLLKSSKGKRGKKKKKSQSEAGYIMLDVANENGKLFLFCLPYAVQ